MAIINNVAYSWSMITLSSTALGIDEGSTTLEGVSAIKWSKKRKVESNYGMGGRPVSRGQNYFVSACPGARPSFPSRMNCSIAEAI